MLDEEEFAIVEALYVRALRTFKEYTRNRKEKSLPIDRNFIQELYQPALNAYRKITGWEEAINPSDMLHHRISAYGPLCAKCKKPLRTPRAKLCAACGVHRSAQT